MVKRCSVLTVVSEVQQALKQMSDSEENAEKDKAAERLAGLAFSDVDAVLCEEGCIEELIKQLNDGAVGDKENAAHILSTVTSLSVKGAQTCNEQVCCMLALRYC